MTLQTPTLQSRAAPALDLPLKRSMIKIEDSLHIALGWDTSIV